MLEVISNNFPTSFSGIIDSFVILLQNLPQNLLFDIGLVLIFAAIVAYIAKMIKQPLIPAYIIAGILLGPLGLSVIRDIEIINVIAEIGIIFLLFICIDFKRRLALNRRRISFNTLFFITSLIISIDNNKSLSFIIPIYLIYSANSFIFMFSATIDKAVNNIDSDILTV